MINPSFDELKEIKDSRYLLVVGVAKRARRIVNGSEALIDSPTKIPVTLALEEIMEGKVKIEENED